MNQKDLNNIEADADADQVRSCIRDGVDIPQDVDIVAAAVRIPLQNMPEAMRESTKRLQELWAKDRNIDTVE